MAGGGRKAARIGTLFLQMEYCRTDLRALIDSGALRGRPSDVFLLLRQILEVR